VLLALLSLLVLGLSVGANSGRAALPRPVAASRREDVSRVHHAGRRWFNSADTVRLSVSKL
jgi:hypothetical protein